MQSRTNTNDKNEGSDRLMGRIILQIIAVLLAIAVLGIIGYAYFGDLRPVQSEQRQSITLPGGTSGN